MAEKTIVIHKGCIDIQLERFLLPKPKRTTLQATADFINNAIGDPSQVVHIEQSLLSGSIPQNAPVYVLDYDDPPLAAKCVNPGDRITLMGAYRRICIKNAALAILHRVPDATVLISLPGSI